MLEQEGRSFLFASTLIIRRKPQYEYDIDCFFPSSYRLMNVVIIYWSTNEETKNTTAYLSYLSCRYLYQFDLLFFLFVKLRE